MNVPRMLKKINDVGIEVKQKIEGMIDETLKCNCIISYPLEEFSIAQLDLLAEYAKENNILIALKAEHSNCYQGVLVGLVKRDVSDKLIKYL